MSTFIQLWAAIGSSIVLVTLAVLKHFWQVRDQRRTSDKKLRDLASVYQAAFQNQNEWLENVVTEILLLDALTPDDWNQCKIIVRRLILIIKRRPDFLAIARKDFQERIPELEDYYESRERN